MARRGPRPNLDIRHRNVEIAALFQEGAEVCDLAIQFGLKPGHIANIVRKAGISARRKRPGPPKRKQAPPRRKHNPLLGAYPLAVRPPLNRAFCDQCDLLRAAAEVEACRSPWCSLKSATPIRRDALPSFPRAGAM